MYSNNHILPSNYSNLKHPSTEHCDDNSVESFKAAVSTYAHSSYRYKGVIEDVSSTEDFIYITDPYSSPYHYIQDHNSAMEPPILMTAGHVEQLAKMSRLPKTSPDQQIRFFPAVKLRNVTYHPPEPTKDTTTKQRPDISSETNTDIDTPRLPTRTDSNKQLFQKNSIPDNEDGVSIDNKSEIERLRNKLQQREQQKHLGHEYIDPRKENRKRRIYTKRERDRMRRTGNQSYDSHDEVMSEMDFRHLRGYHSGRSGCSTPGGSVDEMKLGRNMRAAPRRIDSKDGVRMSQRNTTNKDLIEILNRRQQLLQQQREDRRRFLQDQEAKEKAREIVNLAYLNADSTVSRKRKEGEKLLDDAFSLAKNSQKFNDGYKMESREHSDARDGGSSPRGFTSQQSAADQLWSDGHIQEEKRNSVSSENKKDDDFFEESPKQGPSMGSEDHMVKYVRDELQRLET
ncbi:unnamed protein product [Mytilus coruscus]|uniref:Uncharacterized protein n=1 Tax=Mytilus coruscus TaxID=42192 RepID=A0A6J8C035_MYTCO|nr:unnamed protein product [Mytilus coruscus]